MVLSLSFVPRAYAQEGGGKWYSQSFQEWLSKVDESPETEIFGERYTAAQVQWVIYGLFYFLLNMGTNGNTDAVTCLMNKEVEECVDVIKNVGGGTTGLNNTSGGLSFLTIIGSSPISLSAYLKDVGARLHLVPRADAQGVGFTTAANPALQLWKITRNIAYALLVVVITAISFMIMFRVKISPQVVISVQSALPKIVAALLLITFSYAIAGFLVDLMYVSVGLVAALFVNNGLTTLHWGEMFSRLTTGRNVIELFMSYWFQFLASAILNWVGHVSIAGSISFFVILFSIVAFVVLLFYSLKVVILLLKTYVQIVLLIIVAPFQILLGAISPNAGFGQWLRSMAAQLAVYPIIGTMFVLASLFIRQSLPATFLGIQTDYFSPFDIKFGSLTGQAWSPPLTLGAGSEDVSRLLWLFVSYGIIVLIPKTAEIIQGFISGKPFPFGTAIGESVQKPIQVGAGAGAGYLETKMRSPSYKTDSRIGGAVDKAVSTLLNTIARGGR